MASKSALVTDGAVTQGRELECAGERIDLEHKPKRYEQQSAYVERRFMLPAPIARTAAGIARATEASWSDCLLSGGRT